MIFIWYFEDISSQRGIAWRCADSRSLAKFLGFGPDEATPEHSTLSLTRECLPMEAIASPLS
ncbi:MAG: transposase [Rhodopirellula bahusiensis]